MDKITSLAARILVAQEYNGATMVGMDGYMNVCVYVGRDAIPIEALYDTEEGNKQADVIEDWLKTNCYQLWSDAMPENGSRIDWLKTCLEQIQLQIQDD